MRTQHLGDVRVDKVVELERLPLDAEWLIANSVKEEIIAEQPVLGDGLIEPGTGRLIIGVHSYLIRTGRRTVLVDTCCGNGRHRGDASPFHMLQTDYLGNLARLGVSPEAVDLVFCTHLHVDHVGWNVMSRDGKWVPTFPNARYLFGRRDFEKRIEAEKTGAGSYATREAFKECVLPLVDQGCVTFFEEDSAIDAELDHALRLLPLPGHCPGHTGLSLSGGGRQAVMTGDAIHHPMQLSRPDWFCSADVNPAESTRTRKRLVEDYADTDTLLLTGHFPGATAGRIVGGGGKPGFAFA